IICTPMTSLKTSIKTITYLSDTGCLEIQGASLLGKQSCQMLITRHAVFLIWTIQREKPVQMRLKNRMQMLF
ncbi:hypothetical protein CSW72_26575, partial [Shigella boydii]